MFNLNLNLWKIVAFLAVLISSLVFCSGCAQRTVATSDQPIAQPQRVVNDQAAQGSSSSVNVYITNAPEGNAIPTAGGLKIGPTSRPSISTAAADGTGGTARDTEAGYVIAGTTINITTGGSTTGPQATGAVAGSTASPNATISQSPVQEPKATVPVSAAFGLPGSAPSANSNGSVEGPVTSTNQPTADLKTLFNKAAGGDQAALQQLAQILFNGATSQPATK